MKFAMTVSVPAPPVNTSPVCKEFEVAASNVSLPEPPVDVLRLVVSDLIIVFDILLILNNFLSILLDIKCIAYDVPIFNSKSR